MPEGKKIKNLSASVKQRLLNIAQAENKDYQSVFKQYIQERMLYRVSVSTYSKTFILKGAPLFIIYNISKLRPTKDIDFMGKDIGNDEKVIKDVFVEISKIVADDGLEFNSDSIKTDRIVEDGNYKGIRVSVEVKLDKARDRLQIDIGFGDKIYNGPVEMDYPTLLEQPVPKILIYSIESAIAEKLEANASIGIATSRMKDFFDILFYASKQKLESASLREAIKLTFRNRNTEISTRTRIYEENFKADKQKQTQWTAFLRKNKLEAEVKFERVIDKIQLLIEPLFNLNESKTWNPEKWIWE